MNYSIIPRFKFMSLSIKRTWSARPLLPLILFLMASFVRGQIILQEEPNRRYYDFAARRVTKFKDMRNMRDVFHLDKFLMGKNRIMGNFSYNTGRVLIADERQMYSEYRHALGIYTRIRFYEEFSFITQFFIDFNKRATARWTTDYSYALGRYNWRPKKFNYGYENYMNNKYSDSFEEFCKKFLEGYYFLSYQHNLPQNITKAIALDSTTNLKLIYFARYAIKYRDEFNVSHGGLTKGKTSLGIGARLTLWRNFYAEAAVYYYADPTQRQPWDPDYSYGFGYFDYRAFRLSFTYGNWAINRFDKSDKKYPNYGFKDGQFRVIAGWIW